MLRDVTILGPLLNGDSCTFLSFLISFLTPPFLFSLDRALRWRFSSLQYLFFFFFAELGDVTRGLLG